MVNQTFKTSTQKRKGIGMDLFSEFNFSIYQGHLPKSFGYGIETRCFYTRGKSSIKQ